MIQAEESGDRLSHRRADRRSSLLLYVAGHETTVNLIGNGTLALLRNPDQLRAVARTTRRSTPTAIDELLRYDGPVQLTVRVPIVAGRRYGDVTVEPGTS